MSNIVLKDRQGTKQTYSGVEVIKIADSEGNYNNYVAEPTGEIEITANGSVDVSKYARARVAVPSGSVTEWDGTGVVIAPIEPEQPMTFTINGTSYQMDNRMTWYTWTRSDYNTDGFSCANENDYVYEAESKNKVTDADGNDVLGTTYIVEGGVYLIKEVVASYNITVNNNTVFKANSDNPTQIKAGETVTLTFSSSELYSVTASATNATCTYSTKTASLERVLTVTLSNATDNVVVTLNPKGDLPPV